MKSLWFLSFFMIMTVEVRVKASNTREAEAYEEVLKDKKSHLEKNQILEGRFWFRKTQNAIFKTPFGEINSFQGDFFISYENHRVTVVNHLGELKVTLKDGDEVRVPPGFEFWFSEIQDNKKNQMGFVTPVEMEEHLIVLNGLWGEDPEAFKAEIQKFQSRWGKRADIAAAYYKGLAERKIASEQAREGRIQALRSEERRRREANRKILFDRVFGR